MIESILLDYLTEKLDVPVSLEIPDDKNYFVIIEKTGASETNHIKGAMVAIKSYAPSLYMAALLNEKVKNAMAEIEALDEISQCKLNTDYNFTDVTTKQYRYQAVFDIVHY